jgi:flavin-binding protein dodecin
LRTARRDAPIKKLLNSIFEDAIQVGVSRAVKTLKNVEGVWVANQKCVIKDGKITEYRVDLKVTFILQE